ncbi:hypothetical protein [Enterococcus sp. DIV0849a]|uniref:hypothetical protein n=1 Tax=unclassified Enterococcus TaxID=2608891 RepID=UPI001A8F533B|nr:hypothetical protein [Enterococcus sp. DIV0849a]MBO0434602.1 hypothetical protein [Enterococcus sp. DIV0849a]
MIRRRTELTKRNHFVVKTYNNLKNTYPYLRMFSAFQLSYVSLIGTFIIMFLFKTLTVELLIIALGILYGIQVSHWHSQRIDKNNQRITVLLVTNALLIIAYAIGSFYCLALMPLVGNIAMLLILIISLLFLYSLTCIHKYSFRKMT